MFNKSGEAEDVSINKKVFSSIIAIVATISISGQGPVAHAEETKVRYHEDYDTPSYIVAEWKAPKGLDKKDVVFAYLNENSSLFSLTGNAEEHFEILEEEIDSETGTYHVKLNQMYSGIPIYGSDITVSLDKDNRITSYFGQVIPESHLKQIMLGKSAPKSKIIDMFKYALESSIGTVEKYDGNIEIEPYIYEYDGSFYSTYLVKASTTNPTVGYWHYFIDATNGKIIDSFNAAHEVTAFGYGVFGGKRRFEAQFHNGFYRLFDGTRGGGIVTYDQTTNVNVDVTSLNKLFKDGAAVDAHVNAQKTYDYFKRTFGRDSVDGRGQQLISAVHVGNNWNNASWNGRQMSYGDGDGKRFYPLAGGLDVGAHEMSHGVIQHTAGLIYRNESGALNESFADIFAAMVDRDNWLIGEDIMADGSIALRSMEDPSVIVDERTESGFSPDHWSKRYTGNLDNGGVHINSSINNKAAYLVSEGGEHYGVVVHGVGREAAEQIYYRALSLYLTSSSNFSMMRQAAIQAATDLYGSNSAEVAAVVQAYDAVGVY